MKSLSFVSFIIWSGICEQALEIQDFEFLVGFLGWLEVKGWLTAFSCQELRVVMILAVEFHHSMNLPNLTCVQGLVNGHHFKFFTNDILEFLGVPKEGDVTYFENVTSDVLFQRYIPVAELNGSMLKSGVRYKNPVNSRDLTPIA